MYYSLSELVNPTSDPITIRPTHHDIWFHQFNRNVIKWCCVIAHNNTRPRISILKVMLDDNQAQNSTHDSQHKTANEKNLHIVTK